MPDRFAGDVDELAKSCAAIERLSRDIEPGLD
jgi:hypothetical protein